MDFWAWLQLQALIKDGGIHGWGTTFGTKDLRNMLHWTWCLSDLLLFYQ